MLEAIDRGPRRASASMSYIFRADAAGEAFHQALIEAQRRGVQVRVLIDGVGGGYFWSGTYQRLQPGRRAGRALPAFVFSLAHAVREPAQPSQGAGGRRPHRLHRRAQHRRREHAGRQSAHPVRDTHFRFEGRSSSSSPRPSPTTGCSRPARSCSTRTGSRRSRRRARCRRASSPRVPTRTWSRSSSWRCMPSPAPASRSAS